MEQPIQKPEEVGREKMTKGGRNLIILGVASILIATTTTTISLMIYHNSGDIYLDRSRPGFLPDKEEIEKDNDSGEYVFPKSGKLSPQDLDEYMEKLELEIKSIDSYEKPFEAEVLSDENLGIEKNSDI